MTYNHDISAVVIAAELLEIKKRGYDGRLYDVVNSR